MNHSRNLAFAIRSNSPYDCAGAVGLAMRDNWRGDGELMARAVAIASEIRLEEDFADHLAPFADEIRAASPEQVRALNVSPAMKAALLRILEG